MLRGGRSNLLGSVRSKGGTRARQLAAVPDLRGLRAGDSSIDDVPLLRLRDASTPSHPRSNDPLRVGRLAWAPADAALHDQLLPDGNALHRLRHRDRVPVSAGRHPPPARVVRLPRVPLLHCDPRGCVRVCLAERSARVAMENSVGLTTLEKAVAWAQTKSMWPDTFGLACCAIEMMSIVSSRYDIARFGMEAFRSSPRQADLLI